MIRDCKELREFEARMVRETNNDLQRNIKLYEELYFYARKMLAGRYELDPLEGLDVDIKVAKVVNSV